MIASIEEVRHLIGHIYQKLKLCIVLMKFACINLVNYQYIKCTELESGHNFMK